VALFCAGWNPEAVRVLSARDLYREAALFEFRLDCRALVTLDFYMISFQGAAHAALLLQGAGEIPHLRLWQRKTLDQGDSLAATPLGFPVQAHDAVTHGGWTVPAANAACHRALALGAQAARVGGVNQLAVFVPAHDRAVSLCQVGSILSGLPNANSDTSTATLTGEPGLGEIDEVKRLLVDVQTQLAYQEDTVRQLNEALAAQQQEVLVLRRQLQLLKQRQDEQGPAAAIAPLDERPPHY